MTIPHKIKLQRSFCHLVRFTEHFKPSDFQSITACHGENFAGEGFNAAAIISCISVFPSKAPPQINRFKVRFFTVELPAMVTGCSLANKKYSLYGEHKRHGGGQEIKTGRKSELMSERFLCMFFRILKSLLGGSTGAESAFHVYADINFFVGRIIIGVMLAVRALYIAGRLR